ncbi:integrase [Streptomyces sp. NPDC058195]|uniref:integrase n=1 Tax=Streptomyces sp. NPDC058195 TaxID=3346375 RepID=UPI0036EBFF57
MSAPTAGAGPTPSADRRPGRLRRLRDRVNSGSRADKIAFAAFVLAVLVGLPPALTSGFEKVVDVVAPDQSPVKLEAAAYNEPCLSSWIVAPGHPEFDQGIASSFDEGLIDRLTTWEREGSLTHYSEVKALDRARRPGRSMGSLARALEGFFTLRGLALPTDQAQRLAAGRRRRRIDAIPLPFRPQVQAFAESMLRARERALKAGTLPRTDGTIEAALAIVCDLAHFLIATRNKQDWALTDVHDVEAFLATMPKARQRRLTVLRQYFRFARSHKVVLIDATRGVKANGPSGFSGTTVAVDQQRQLFRRWTTGADAHPHEALLGILALLHAASSSEVRLLRVDDLDPANRTIRLGKRPHPVPMDPASWSALQRCLAHRADQRTDNPHVIVTQITKTGRAPASTAYVSHLLDPCGVPPRTLRSTRLADLVNTLDPKLVAAVLGMEPEGVMIYLADHVDTGRLPNP